MTPQFLRHEASRFRGMAEDADREATKVRLLAMAADYEARAGTANELTEPNSGDDEKAMTEPNSGDANMRRRANDDVAPGITLGRKVATGLKETVLVQRRPVGRPRPTVLGPWRRPSPDISSPLCNRNSGSATSRPKPNSISSTSSESSAGMLPVLRWRRPLRLRSIVWHDRRPRSGGSERACWATCKGPGVPRCPF